jgi:hypothetical protein
VPGLAEFFTGASRCTGLGVKGLGSFSNRVRRPQLMQRYTTKDMPVSKSTSWTGASVPWHRSHIVFGVPFIMNTLLKFEKYPKNLRSYYLSWVFYP